MSTGFLPHRRDLIHCTVLLPHCLTLCLLSLKNSWKSSPTFLIWFSSLLSSGQHQHEPRGCDGTFIWRGHSCLDFGQGDPVSVSVLATLLLSSAHSSVIQQVFVTRALCARHWFGSWGFSAEQENKVSDFMEFCYCGKRRMSKQANSQIPSTQVQ